MFVEFNRDCFVPYKIGDVLRATIDLDCTYFPRPIHASCRVVREQGGQNQAPLGLGIEFVEVQREHRPLFENILAEQEIRSDREDSALQHRSTP